MSNKIKEINISNFKCFSSNQLCLADLTVLAGLNSAGKSSVIQSLLLLRQSKLCSHSPNFQLCLNGELTKVGTFKDALRESADGDEIGFGIRADASTLSGTWSPDAINVKISDDDIYNANLFTADQIEDEGINFCYLSAERIGPRTFFDAYNESQTSLNLLGTQGQYAFSYLGLKGLLPIANRSMADDKQSKQLSSQVGTWLGELSPGIRATAEPIWEMDLTKLTYSYDLKDGRSREYRATNVGFGLTYTLPIIIAILSIKPGGLLLLENPEAHLHPKGQTILGTMLAQAAASGIQVIVETHSDHLINGIRVAISRGNLDNEKAVVHFFSRMKKCPVPVVNSLTINKRGNMSEWPKDFLSEWEGNLVELI